MQVQSVSESTSMAAGVPSPFQALSAFANGQAPRHQVCRLQDSRDSSHLNYPTGCLLYQAAATHHSSPIRTMTTRPTLARYLHCWRLDTLTATHDDRIQSLGLEWRNWYRLAVFRLKRRECCSILVSLVTRRARNHGPTLWARLLGTSSRRRPL